MSSHGSTSQRAGRNPAGGAPVADGRAASAELEALLRGALLVELTDQRRLTLTGADRLDFLHGQLSNEVRGLPQGGANRSLLLNHKGHALAELRVLHLHERIELLVEGDASEVVERSLRSHIVFDQVELSRAAEHRALTLQGPAAGAQLSEALLGEPPGPERVGEAEFAGRPLLLVESARTAAGGYDLYLPDGAIEPLVERLRSAGAVVGGRAALELARVCAGLPSAAGEAGEGVLPQEAGLEPLVSYRKGCYLGQEIMARIESRGKLRRELGGLRLDGEPAPGERDLRSGGRSVGRLGTVVRHPRLGLLALAVVRSDLAEGESLEVGGVPARRVALPFDEPLGL